MLQRFLSQYPSLFVIATVEGRRCLKFIVKISTLLGSSHVRATSNDGRPNNVACGLTNFRLLFKSYFHPCAGENLTTDTLDLVLVAIHDPGIESADNRDFNRNLTFIVEPLWKGGMPVHYIHCTWLIDWE